MEKYKIDHEDQIPEILKWALAGHKTLSLQGNGTKMSIGRPIDADACLSFSALNEVQMHEPAELVMQAKAGTPLDHIKEILKQSDQRLAFLPPDLGPLLGGEEGQSTIGGVFACNLSGSSRLKAGAARDHLLGVKGFSGRGEPFQAGSRVMKNVTGYDLCKLVCGSYGTIALCTSLIFKVLPQPEKARTVLLFGLTADEAVIAMKQAMSSVHDVSAAAYLPKDIAAKSEISHLTNAEASVTALLVEGPGPSAEYRCAALLKAFSRASGQDELHGHNSKKLWSFLGDVKVFCADQDRPVWRISLPPASAPLYIRHLEEFLPDAEYYMDWAGGLIWLCVPEAAHNAGVGIVRCSLLDGGHATLIRGSEALRLNVSPFQPQNKTLTQMSERVRAGFDPQGIFNPGHMYRQGETA